MNSHMAAHGRSNIPKLSEAAKQRILASMASGRDELNPDFLFSLTATDLLVAITADIIDPVKLAHLQLAHRGLDQNGSWVGFQRAREIHQV